MLFSETEFASDLESVFLSQFFSLTVDLSIFFGLKRICREVAFYEHTFQFHNYEHKKLELT